MIIDTWDVVALVIYFAAVLFTGCLSMCRSNRGTVSGYFLAGRFMTWLPVGASIFASNIGSEHFIGLAGSGAAMGIGVGAFELNACILLQLLGWLFLPVYIASKVCTLPEYMWKRFGGRRIQVYLAVLSLLLYILTKISVNLYSGSLFLREALGWDIWLTVLLLLAFTGLVTITGGLAAVMFTDTLQCFIMILGAIILTVISFVKVGGYQGLVTRYGSAVANETLLSNSSCGLPNPKAFVMLRGITDSEMPWLGFLVGQTPASIWYWCADQMMVQRALASKSLSHARGGILFASALKLLPMFIMVMPGMISRIFFPDVVACSSPESCLAVCGQKHGCSNLAYPKLVLGLMPSGLRGVMLAVMLAALMSDLTSIFNSASTLFTVDIYRLVRKTATTRELMIVGRVFVCVMIIVSVLWMPVISLLQGGQLFIYVQAISAYLSPPIAAVYLIAILWKRANEKGAFFGLVYGFILGVLRLILDFMWSEPLCGEPDTRPLILRALHYMYFALFSFSTSAILTFIISLCSQAPNSHRLNCTTVWTLHSAEREREEVAMEPLRNAQEERRSSAMSAAEDTGAPSTFGWRLLRWLGRQFCGLEASEPQAEAEAVVLAKVTSLRQHPVVFRVQVVLLGILVALSATLITLLSIPDGPFAKGYEPLTKPAALSVGNLDLTASTPRE